MDRPASPPRQFLRQAPLLHRWSPLGSLLLPWGRVRLLRVRHPLPILAIGN